MKCYNSTHNRGDWNVMVMTLRKKLATLVSLVTALARESLYLRREVQPLFILDLDLEGSQFLY